MRRSSPPVTAGLIGTLNEVLDDAMAPRFAYVIRVPADIMLGLYGGALLSIEDLNLPRIGNIEAAVAPLVWTIQGFQPN